jgi:hypothetical protein
LPGMPLASVSSLNIFKVSSILAIASPPFYVCSKFIIQKTMYIYS